MFLSGKYKMVPIIDSADINAGVDGDSINMAKAHRCTFLFMFGALGGAAGAILKVFSGISDAAKTSPLTFRYALGSAATGSATADVLGDAATSAALTLTAATYQNKLLVVEVDGAEMDMANNEEWLTVEIGAEADSGVLHVVAVVEPRYSDGTTVLA